MDNMNTTIGSLLPDSFLKRYGRLLRYLAMPKDEHNQCCNIRFCATNCPELAGAVIKSLCVLKYDREAGYGQ